MTLNKFIKELEKLKKKHGGDLYIELDFKRDEDGFVVLPMNYNTFSYSIIFSIFHTTITFTFE